MDNRNLQFFRSQIGKAIENSPSPLGNWLNGTFVDVNEGEMTLSFRVRKEMTNPVGILHGGAACAIIDDVMGMTVYALDKEFVYVTVSLTVDFLDNAREGETIFAKTKVIRNGRTLVNVECHLLNEAGKMLAKGTSNLVATRIPAG
ncbi:MAG: PaaI family thioesterase [Cytophagales bacterium]|jgi:uncharacterized protein (TIGR00369 family)|nr:PaaI family thioesterase [Cytophagales bacterium]